MFLTLPKNFTIPKIHLWKTVIPNLSSTDSPTKFLSKNFKKKIENPKPPKDPKEFGKDELWLRVPYDPYIWSQLKKLCNESKVKLRILSE